MRGHGGLRGQAVNICMLASDYSVICANMVVD